jgi:hypothetical protein
VITSMVKKDAFRARSIGRKSGPDEMYFFRTRATSACTCLSTRASRPSISFPEYYFLLAFLIRLV